MKLLRKARALFNKVVNLVKNIRRAPGRVGRWFGRVADAIAAIRAGARRFGRNPDAERARRYAEVIQADLARQGLRSEYTVKRFKRSVKRQKRIEFLPPLVVTSTGVMMRVATGLALPSGVQIDDINNQKVIDTLAHAVGQEVYVTAKDPRLGTLINVVEVSAVDGIPRLIWSTEVEMPEDNPLSFVVGRGKNGNVIADLQAMPHYLVAGATRQGKSVHMWHVITTIARRNNPADVRFALFDLKRGAMFHPLRNLPHLMFPIVDDIEGVLPTFEALIEEMDRRYMAIRARGQSTVEVFNRLPGVEKMPLIVVALDELAEITRSEDRGLRLDGTANLVKLLRQSAGAGIHFVVSTQHPNADVLKGEIRANLPDAVAFRTAKRTQSEVIIEQGGAELIKVKGRGLFKTGADLVEVQTPLIEEGSGAHGIYSVISAIVLKWQSQAAQAGEAARTQADADQELDRLLKEDMLRFASVNLGGKFQTRAIFNEFKGRVTQKRVEAIAVELEKEGVLSPSAGRAARRVIGSLCLAEVADGDKGGSQALCLAAQENEAQDTSIFDVQDTFEAEKIIEGGE